MFRVISSLSIAVVLALTVCSAFGQDPATNLVEAAGTTNGILSATGAGVAPAAAEVTATDQWITWCKQGGRTMIFLGIMSIIGLGCGLERLVNLRVGRIVPEGFSTKVVAMWKDDKIDDLKAECAKDKSMLARVVETMMEHGTSTDYQEVKLFAEDKAGRELRLENRKAAMLALVATLSPLLGLFGTVVGLLDAFTTVAQVGEMGDPSILADSISKALITTVTGLAIAMPALFVYNIVKNRLSLYSVLLEEEVSDLVNSLFIKISR